MFLAAAPYFQKRFAGDEWILANFQSLIISVSTATNLTSMLILTHIQYSASYPFRINAALLINVVAFALLTISTSIFLSVSSSAYLFFLLAMVAASAWATGMIQNGAFAFASSFGRPEYLQALMAGQGVAGVLPPIAQVVSVLAVPESDSAEHEAPRPDPNYGGLRAAGGAAFVYFLTAVAVSGAALVAFVPLARRGKRVAEQRAVDAMTESMHSVEEAERTARKVVGLATLFRKLRWLATAIFMCFVVAMFFPVFTTKVLSVSDDGTPATPPILRASAFIPLAFFFWNLGDFLGRVATGVLPKSIGAALARKPVVLFAFSIARISFLPLYLLCNLRGQGAVVPSDAFYLLGVQLPFGLTNGYLGSACMMAAGSWVEDGEREAAGSFMGLSLVLGLTVGSLLSFTAAGI